MSKKKLNTSGVLNELSGQSVFFQRDQSPGSKEQSESISQVDKPVRPVRLPTKRERKRHPFDIYRDQLETLLQLKSRHMMEKGEMKSMSEMVREALDTYIQTKHKRTERS